MARLFLVTLLFVPTLAFAQQPRFEISPFVGYIGGGEILLDDSQLTNGVVGVDLVRSSQYGLRVNTPTPWNRKLQLEFLYSTQQSQVEDVQRLFGEQPSGPVPPGDSDFLDADISYLHAGALWNIDRSLNRSYEMKPYVAAGLGLTHFAFKLPLKSDNVLSASVGTGIKWAVGNRFGLRLETRGYWSNTNDDNKTTVPINTRDCTGQCERTYGYPDGVFQYDLTLGLTFGF